MSEDVIAGHLDELLKIPEANQDPSTLQQLQDYRKKLADEFYHKTGEKYDTPYDRKTKIFPDLQKLHAYFGYKEIKKPFAPNKYAKKVVSVEDRIANCDAFLKYVENSDANTILALSHVWSNS